MNSGNVNTIRSLLEKNVREELGQMTQVNWISLQQAANNFLSQQAIFKNAKIQMQKRQTIVALNEVAGYENYSSDLIKTAKDSKNFYRALFKFDQALTNYLNEVPKRGMYVFFDTEGRPHTYDMSLEQLASISQGRGRIGKLSTKDLASIESQIDQESEEYKEHIQQGASAAIGVNKRLDQFYARRGKQTKVDKDGIERTRTAQKQSGLLMWKTAGTWKIAKIANQGVIGEAYAQFLLTKHKTRGDYLVGIERGDPPFYSHSLIAKFYKYLSTVTNNPAIVEEDIYTEWAQYAVKGQKAGLPTPEQYIRTAYTILSSSDEIAPEKLKQMITNEFYKDSKLAPFIGEFLDKNVDKVVAQMMEEAGFKEAMEVTSYLRF